MEIPKPTSSNDSPLLPGVPDPEKYAQIIKRRKITRIIVVAGSILVVAIPALLLIVFLFINNARDQSLIEDARSFNAKPAQTDAFLDSRYEKGARPLTIKGLTSPLVLGLNTERSKIAVFTTNQAAGSPDQSNDESVSSQPKKIASDLSVIDVNTGEKTLILEYEMCSNVTNQGTVYCSKYDELSATRAHLLDLVNIEDGSVTPITEVTKKPLDSIKFLGQSNDATLLQIRTDGRLDEETFNGFMAVAQDNSVLWTEQIKPTFLPQCALYGNNSTILCKTKATESTSAEDVIAINAKTGKQITRKTMNSEPVMTAEGWVVRETDYASSGIDGITSGFNEDSLDGAKPKDVVRVYGVDGEHQRKGGTIAELIPTPKFQSGDTISYSHKDIIKTNGGVSFVVGKDGNVLAYKKDFARDGKPIYLSTLDGKKSFDGLPKGITANGKTVIVTNSDTSNNPVYRLVNLETGKDLQTLKFSGDLVSSEISHGILVNKATGKTEMYLPGKY